MEPVKELKDLDEWKNTLKLSCSSPVILFKFSPVCPLSHYAENEFFSYLKENPKKLKVFTVNVISSRSVSKQAEADLNVTHQSPQVLLVSQGECIWNESHGAITANNLETKISQNI